jgi:hypothetical protein
MSRDQPNIADRNSPVAAGFSLPFSRFVRASALAGTSGRERSEAPCGKN